ncbi:MAG: ankyrin repeat domain-containing protein [Rickettsiaceae bacterium]|nr:ankyrin repeat domain-containing protein [Rickettsiaceae bacterium]
MINRTLEVFNSLQKGDSPKALELINMPDTDLNASTTKPIIGSYFRLIHTIIFFDRSDLLRILIEKGVDLSLKDSSNISPICAAITYNQTESAKILLENEAKIDEDEEIILMNSASRNNNLELVKLLVSKGIDVNPRGLYSTTPLHEVCGLMRGNSDLVKYLLTKGAIVNAIDTNGNTPLHSACKSGSIEIVKLLYIAGANIFAKNIYDETPLWAAVNYVKLSSSINYYVPQIHEIVNFMIPWGANISDTHQGNSLMDVLMDIHSRANEKNKEDITLSIHYLHYADKILGGGIFFSYSDDYVSHITNKEYNHELIGGHFLDWSESLYNVE